MLQVWTDLGLLLLLAGCDQAAHAAMAAAGHKCCAENVLAGSQRLLHVHLCWQGGCADGVQAAGWLLGAVLARQVLLSLGAVLSTIPFAPPVMTVLWVIPHPGALQVNNLDT
jgi:hypothetical protein